jgi:hypothetical protein
MELYALTDLCGMNTFNKAIFIKIKKKYELGWRLKVKIHILFYGNSSRTVALRQEMYDIY